MCVKRCRDRLVFFGGSTSAELYKRLYLAVFHSIWHFLQLFCDKWTILYRTIIRSSSWNGPKIGWHLGSKSAELYKERYSAVFRLIPAFFRLLCIQRWLFCPWSFSFQRARGSFSASGAYNNTSDDWNCFTVNFISSQLSSFDRAFPSAVLR